MNASEQARILWPYLLPMVKRAIPVNGHPAPVVVTGGGGGGPTNLAELNDVQLAGLTNGQLIQWNSGASKWQNVTFSAGAVLSAGNGIDITGNLISIKLQAAGGLLADGNGVAVKRPTDSGLVLSTNGVAVGAGDGIDVVGTTVLVDATDIIDLTRGLYEPTANNIGINLAPSSGIVFNGSGQLLMGTPGDLAHDSVSSLSASSHTHNVVAFSDVGSAPKAGLLQSDGFGALTVAKLTIYGNLAFMGGTRDITASNTLNLKPITDLRLDPGGVIAYPDSQESRSDTFNDFVAGIYGWRMWDPTYIAPGPGANTMLLTIGGIKADELSVKKFTADEARVNRGEEFWARSFGIVQEKFTLPADEGTVDVWFEEAPGLGNFKLFLPNNWLLLRTIDWGVGLEVYRIWFQVVDGDGAGLNDWVAREEKTATVPSRQLWRLRRKFSLLASSSVIKPGEVIVDFGLPNSTTPPGQGIVHLSALAKDGGPFVQIQTFENVIADVPQFKNRARMGNLSGTVDYTGIAWGFAAGNDLSVLPSAGFSGFAVDAVSGLRMFNTDIKLYQSSILSAALSRVHGLSMRNDSTPFANDLRNIAWYDDLPENLNLTFPTAIATAKIGSYGDVDNRVLLIGTFGTLAETVQISTSGGSDESASISVNKKWGARYGGSIFLSAQYVLHMGGEDVGGNIRPRFRIGASISSNAAISNLHVYANDTAINETTGITFEQVGAGDSIFHWQIPAKAYTAGIDNSDGDKWKLSIGNSLGTNDVIIVDPSTGLVTISGLTGSGGTPITGLDGGDGIDISVAGGVSTIAVDTTVVRTTRTVGAGDGLMGGGSLAANITLAVNSTVVRTGRNILTSGAMAGGGDLSNDRTITLTLLPTNPGLTQTGNALAVLLAANSGLSLVGGLNIPVTFGGDGLYVTGGIMNIDPSLAGNGLVYAAGIMYLNNNYVLGTTLAYRNIETRNGLAGGGTLDADLILDVDINPTGGLRHNDEKLEVFLATDGGLAFSGGILINLAYQSGLYSGVGGFQIDPAAGGLGMVFAGGQFNIGTPTTGAMTINADSIEVKIPASGSGLVKNTSGLSVDPNIAGGGLVYSSGVIGVNAGVTMEVVADVLNVNQAHTFNWLAAGSHTFNALTTFNNNITFTTADRIISTAGSLVLTIAPGGDLVLNPGGSDTLPGGNGIIDLGDYNRKWRTLYVAELVAETLVAREVTTSLGGRIIVSESSVLVADMTNVQTYMDVKHNNFVNGSFVRLQTAPNGIQQTEVMKTTSGPSSVTGGWRYNVTRNLDESGGSGTLGANVWAAGDGVSEMGSVVGTGFLELTSTSTALGHQGPTVTVYGRTGTALWTDAKPLVTMGNLDSFVGYGVEYGFAVGNDLTLTPTGGFSGITVDRTFGLRMFNTIIEMYETNNLVVAIDKSRGMSFEAAPPLTYGAGVPWRYPRNISWYVDLDDLTVPIVNDPPIVNYRPPVAVIGVAVNSTVSYNMSIAVLGDSYATPARPGLIELRSSAATLTLGATGGWSFSLPVTASRGDIWGDINGVRIGDSDYTVVMSTLNVHEITTATGVTAGVKIQQGGTGDSVLRWHLTGGQYYSMGIDNSDNDNFKISRGNQLGVAGTDMLSFSPGGGMSLTASPLILPPVHPTNSSTMEIKFANRTSSYLIATGPLGLGKISSWANMQWNANYTAANAINASEIEFLYSASNEGRVITSTVGINIQTDHSGALHRALTMTAYNSDFSTHLTAGTHATGYRWRQATVPGYYVNTNRVNLVAFNMPSYSVVIVRIMYTQYNTGDGAQEIVMGTGVATITHDNATGFYVGLTGYLGTQNCTLAWQIVSPRILFYINRTAGAGLRPDDPYRVANIEIMGVVSGITYSPAAI